MTEEPLIKTTTMKIKRPAEYEKVRETLEKAGIDMRKASGRFVRSLEKQDE
jgi:long-chain acyl-CoA synthetase